MRDNGFIALRGKMRLMPPSCRQRILRSRLQYAQDVRTNPRARFYVEERKAQPEHAWLLFPALDKIATFRLVQRKVAKDRQALRVLAPCCSRQSWSVVLVGSRGDPIAAGMNESVQVASGPLSDRPGHVPSAGGLRG